MCYRLLSKSIGLVVGRSTYNALSKYSSLPQILKVRRKPRSLWPHHWLPRQGGRAQLKHRVVFLHPYGKNLFSNNRGRYWVLRYLHKLELIQPRKLYLLFLQALQVVLLFRRSVIVRKSVHCKHIHMILRHRLRRSLKDYINLKRGHMMSLSCRSLPRQHTVWDISFSSV